MNNSAIVDSRIPPRDHVVVRYLLERWAKEKPDEVYAVFENGESWTFNELLDKVNDVANGLYAQGVRQGDHVAMWLFSGAESILTFYAINYLGAVFVPFNTAYKGAILEHVIANSDARIMVSHAQLIDRLDEIDTAKLQQLILVGETDPGWVVRR